MEDEIEEEHSMQVSSGALVRGITVVAGGVVLFASSRVEEAVVLTIIGVSLIVIGAVAFLAHSILSGKEINKKILILASIVLLCVGGVGTALTDWSPSNTPIPWFFLIYAGAGLLLSLPGLDLRRGAT